MPLRLLSAVSGLSIDGLASFCFIEAKQPYSGITPSHDASLIVTHDPRLADRLEAGGLTF